MRSIDQLRNIAVTDGDGLWIESSVAPHSPISSSDRPYFAWHRDHEGDRSLHIGTMIFSHDGQQPMIPLSRRLNNPDGSFAGVSVAALEPDYFASFYATLSKGERGAIAVWRTDGRLLARHPAAPDSLTRDFSDTPLFRALAQTSAGVFDAPPGRVDGVERIVAYERLQKYPTLLVSSAIATDEALVPWRREALIQGGAIMAAALALLGLSVGFWRRDQRILTAEEIAGENAARYRLLAENTSDLIVLRSASPKPTARLLAASAAPAWAWPSVSVSSSSWVGRSGC